MKHSPAPKLRQPRQHLNQPTVWPIDADASRLPGLGRRQWRLQPSLSDWRTALDPARPQASILSNPHVTSRPLHGESFPENRKGSSLGRVDAGCVSNPSKAQERSAEQELEKSNSGGADSHGSPRSDRVRAGLRTGFPEETVIPQKPPLDEDPECWRDAAYSIRHTARRYSPDG